MVDNVTVTQEDREAAAAYGEAIRDLSPGQVAQVLAGMWDDLPRVRWFAEHRARLSPAPEGVDARELLAANIRPALVRFVADHGADIDWRLHEAATQEIVGTVVAIQALSRPPAEQVRMREALDNWEGQAALNTSLACGYSVPPEAGRSPYGKGAQHAFWMLSEIAWGRVQGRKAHRWLGYAQGLLVEIGLLSLDAAKLANKEASDAAALTPPPKGQNDG